MSQPVEESDTESSENDDNYCESTNDADSLHLEEEEEDDTNAFSLGCSPSERLIGGSIILHIDQAARPSEQHDSRNDTLMLRSPFETPSSPASSNFTNVLPPTLPHANQSISTTTSLSDAPSENMSTCAVMGDTPSSTAVNAGQGDDVDNSSQTSMTDGDVERVRRIHNSIFSSLEHDLAELVRIREETIQFLESGSRPTDTYPNDVTAPVTPQNELGIDDTPGEEEGIVQGPLILRERLTFHSRPVPSINSLRVENNPEEENSNVLTFNGQSYTPTATFDNVPPAKPAKPYLEVGLTHCEEKAAAARKIFDKLQYAYPEDETACFVRRFWRETSTVVDPPQDEQLPVTIDAASLVQRTASLQASLEEAFDGLQMRLQQVRAQAAASANQESQGDGQQGAEHTGNCGENPQRQSLLEATSGNNESSETTEPDAGDVVAQYQRWDEDTSIMNNPLNYDIWDELENGGEAGPTITARINLSERRSSTATSRLRNGHSARGNHNVTTTTTTVGVGPDSGGIDGGDELDDSNDEEQILNWFGFRDGISSIANDSQSNSHNFSPATREFFQDIGISEDLGRDIFNMFTLSEEDIQVVSRRTSGMRNSEIPEPLFPRNADSEIEDNGDEGSPVLQGLESASDADDDNDNDSQIQTPQVPLVDDTECTLFAPNREDDCSMRVYLDEMDLNFSRSPRNQNENQE